MENILLEDTIFSGEDKIHVRMQMIQQLWSARCSIVLDCQLSHFLVPSFFTMRDCLRLPFLDVAWTSNALASSGGFIFMHLFFINIKNNRIQTTFSLCFFSNTCSESSKLLQSVLYQIRLDLQTFPSLVKVNARMIFCILQQHLNIIPT